MKTFKKYVDERMMSTPQKVAQMQHYWDDLDHLASDDMKKKKMEMKFGIKNIKLDPRKGKITSFDEKVELDEVYGTVKISGKRGRLVSDSPGEIVFVGNKKQAEKNLKQVKKDGGDGYIMQGVTIKVGEKVKGVEEERDYKDEYKKFQSTKKAIKYRSELNQYNRKRGTYGNNDGKDASHKNGKIVGFEDESTNRGRREKSRLKVNETFKSFEEYFHESRLDDKLDKLVSNEIKKRKLAKFPVNATDDIKMRMKPNKPVFKFPSPNSDMMIHVFLRPMKGKKGMMAFNYQLEDK